MMDRYFSSRFQKTRRVAVSRMFAIVCGAFILAALAFVADAGLPEKKVSYDTFRMVRTRNIFDPDRRAMVVNSARSQVSSPPPTRSDYVALNGILVTGEKSLAFFSGSRAEYSKVLPVQGSIAGATIVKITPDAIVVDMAGKQTTVTVGQTIPLDGSTPAPAPVPAATSTSSSSDSPPTASPQTSSPGAPADMTETMRRMMERRQKELQ